MTVGRTEVECTANGGDDELNRPKRAHGGQNGTTLIENCVDPDNMSSWRNRVRLSWSSGAGRMGVPEQQATRMAVVIGSNR